MSGQVFGEWINGGTESLRPASDVVSGKIRAASVCFERQIQLTDQKSLVVEPNEIRSGRVSVLYWKGAESTEMKVMAVDRVEAYRGVAIVQRVWVEYDAETNVQMNHIIKPERGWIESAVV